MNNYRRKLVIVIFSVIFLLSLIVVQSDGSSNPDNLFFEKKENINSLTGDFSDYGLDSDGDGRFDYLCINVGVNISQERELFYLDMELRSVIGNSLFIKRIHNSSLNLGRNTLSVRFNVFDPAEFDPSLNILQLNTSYRMDYVEFGYVGNSGATYFPINQMSGSFFITRVYNYTEFDSPESYTSSSMESKTTITSTTSSSKSIP
ncbi:unnamed protein product, partial [marine sediment metagenome]